MEYLEIEKPLTLAQTASVIDILKKVPFLIIDIYSDILLTKDQQNDLEKRISNTETTFFSEVFNVKKKAIYSHDIQIIYGDEENPLKHGICMDVNRLSGKEIVKIGFSDLYGRFKVPRINYFGRAINLLQISKIETKSKKEYLLQMPKKEKIDIHSTLKKYSKLVKGQHSKLISVIKKNLY